MHRPKARLALPPGAKTGKRLREGKQKLVCRTTAVAIAATAALAGPVAAAAPAAAQVAPLKVNALRACHLQHDDKSANATHQDSAGIYCLEVSFGLWPSVAPRGKADPHRHCREQYGRGALYIWRGSPKELQEVALNRRYQLGGVTVANAYNFGWFCV
jgi:hypothetical protein